jgi:deaminated glutathione amidase
LLSWLICKFNRYFASKRAYIIGQSLPSNCFSLLAVGFRIKIKPNITGIIKEIVLRPDHLTIASCQFAVGASIEQNAKQIVAFLHKAKKNDAEIVHFPECALSGYIGVDIDSIDHLDWSLLLEKTKLILDLAGQLRLWVILGSSHRLTAPNRPHNCLYLISPQGEIVDRYDKRFCTEGDLDHYTPGNRFVTFTVNGLKCALLICFDLRFPELYRALKAEGVQCVFQSFYNARQTKPSIHTHIMRQTMQCRAATNYFWVSMTNSSGYYSPYASCFITPNGKIANQLKQNRPGLMVNTVNSEEEFYDPSKAFRPLAMKGVLSNGCTEIKDPRSENTTVL